MRTYRHALARPERASPGWADAGVIIPWSAYLQFRDKAILQENWSAMEKWMDAS